MRIADRGGSHFNIRRIGIDSGRNVHAKVHAAGFGFSGANKSVWFQRENIDEFLRDMRILNATREGKAVL